MTPSPDILLRHAAMGTLTAVTVVCAALQIDVRSGLLAGMPDSTQGTVSPALGVQGTLYGSFSLGKGIVLSFDDHLAHVSGLNSASETDGSSPDAVTGATKKIPLAERNVLSENSGTIDLSWYGLRLGYRNILYGKTRGLDKGSFLQDNLGYFDSLFTYTFQFKRKMRQLYEGQYRFENDRAEVDASLHHIITNATVDTMLNFFDYMNSAPVALSATRAYLCGGMRLPQARIRLLAGVKMNIDHSGPAAYNSYNPFFTVAGNAEIDDHRLEYRLQNDYYSQKYLTDPVSPAYAITGMFQTLYLRGTVALTRGLMLKGVSVVTWHESVLKQRYEAAIRKAWFGGSSIEGGATTTMGGLFPMVGYYLRSTIHPISALSLSLWTKSLWDWPREDAGEFAERDKTLFVKTNGGGEIAYRLGGSTEFYLSGDGTYFNVITAKEFPTRVFAGGGVRLFLQ